MSKKAARERARESRSLRGNVDRNLRCRSRFPDARPVVPYVGTWIEIDIRLKQNIRKYGRSLRGNVDRNAALMAPPPYFPVVPYVGTWIEMLWIQAPWPFPQVVPYVGTWIEMPISAEVVRSFVVVPYVGTWIEILTRIWPRPRCISRSLRGNVDRNPIRCAVWRNLPQSFPTWERG
mgnify:CR=1 FL=1